MALPTSRSQLIEYALRALGAPVINIEYDEEQLNDRVDYALRKFVDRHYDGQTESFYFAPITRSDYEKGYVTLPSETQAVLQVLNNSMDGGDGFKIEPFDSIRYYQMWDYLWGAGMSGGLSNYWITMSNLSLIDFVLGNPRSFTYNSVTKRLYPHHDWTYIGTGNLLGTNYATLEHADWTKTNCTATDLNEAIPNGDLEASTLTSSGAGVFGVSAKYETDNYVRGLYTSKVILKQGTYTGQVKVSLQDREGTVVKSTTHTLSTKWEEVDVTGEYKDTINDLVVVVETVTAAAGAGETFHVWSPSLYANNFILLHCYRSYDPDELEDIWHEEWIMKYVTALVKYQWGSNIKKYQGVQLPGGVEMTGQQIFDEASAELERLDEDFARTYELPADMYWG